MDPGIVLLVVFLALLAGGAAVWYYARKRLPASTVQEIAAAAAAVIQILDRVVDEEQVRDLAGFLYDRWGYGSEYLERDEFIELILRAVTASNASSRSLGPVYHKDR